MWLLSILLLWARLNRENMWNIWVPEKEFVTPPERLKLFADKNSSDGYKSFFKKVKEIWLLVTRSKRKTFILFGKVTEKHICLKKFCMEFCWEYLSCRAFDTSTLCVKTNFISSDQNAVINPSLQTCACAVSLLGIKHTATLISHHALFTEMQICWNQKNHPKAFLLIKYARISRRNCHGNRRDATGSGFQRGTVRHHHAF